MCDSTTLTEETFCRICHDDQGDLHKLCNCKGSIGLVHLECQEKWLKFKGNKICDICGYDFEFKAPLDYIDQNEVIIKVLICELHTTLLFYYFYDIFYDDIINILSSKVLLH